MGDPAPAGWRESYLGELLTESDERGGAEAAVFDVLSLTKHHGVVPARERFSRALHGKDLSRYRVSRRNSIVVDPMLLWDGIIALQERFEAGLVSPDYRVFQPTALADPSFLKYLTSSEDLRRQYRAAARGTNVRRRRIDRDDFLGLKTPMPPLSEQRRIAKILAAVDVGIAAAQAVLAQVEVVKGALMNQLLTRGLPGRHREFVQTKIGLLPASWKVVPLGQLAELQPGFAFKSAEFSDDGDRLLRGSNVGINELDWSPARTVFWPSKRRDEFEQYALSAGDIVVGMDRPFIGGGFKIARVRDEDLPALLLQRVGRFRSYVADREFFWALLNSGFVQGILRVQQKGTDLPHISKREIEGCLVPNPSSEEQSQIGEALQAFDQRTRRERVSIGALIFLKRGLHDALVSGRLRVANAEREAV